MATVKESNHREQAQQICMTLQGLGHFKVYGNDNKTETLSFKPHKEYATEQWTDLVVKCLGKIGFTNVQNNKEKKSFFHSVRATIVCEYDASYAKIQMANISDVQALCYMFEFMRVWCTIFIPSEAGRRELPYKKHLANLQAYLAEHSSQSHNL